MPAPLAGMALSLTPVALSYMHGRSKGKKDPSKGGVGGSIASGMLLNPLSGMAYGLGHRHGRDAAVDEVMDSFSTGAPVDNVTLRHQDVKRDKSGRAFMNLLDTNENVRTLMGEKMPQFVNQYGGTYDPLAANINQRMIRNVAPNPGVVGHSAPMDYRGARLNMVGQDPNMMYY